jgi:hypothetical protein
VKKKNGRDAKNLKILLYRKEVFRPFPSVGMDQFEHDLLHQTLLAGPVPIPDKPTCE